MKFLREKATWLVKCRYNKHNANYGPRPKHDVYGFLVKATSIRNAIRNAEILFWRRVTKRGFFTCSAEEIKKEDITGIKKSRYMNIKPSVLNLHIHI